MEFNHNIDFKLEALYLLKKYNDDEDQEVINNYLSYGLDQNQINKLFNKYLAFKNKIIKEIPEIKKTNLPYFKPYLRQHLSIMIDFYLIYNKNNDFQKSMEILYQELLDLNDDISLEKVVRIVNGLDVEDYSKLILINFYNNEELFQDLMQDVEKVALIIKKHFSIIKDEYEYYFHKFVNDEKLIEKVNKILNHNFFQGNETIKFQVMIFPYNYLSLKTFDNLYYINCGYLIFDLDDLKNKYVIDDKKVINTLKAISEASRFKILKLLKERPRYAQELAEELQLTSATLIHHLTTLLDGKLIGIIIQNDDKKRIYYELKKETIQELITSLQRLL